MKIRNRVKKAKKKKRISARLIDRDVVDDDNGHKVTIDVYDTGEYKEYLRGDKVVRQRQIKFVMKYNSVVKECFDECKDATKAIVKATHYNVSSKDLITKISELRDEYVTPEEISVVDYVREKYPDKLAEIERNPFNWILQKTSGILGYERLKLLTVLAIISSRLRRIEGMSRVSFTIVGQSGAGKSSVIKSILRFVDDNIQIAATQFTKKALGYLDIDTFDGKIIFLDQIDDQNIDYIREALTEQQICTYVTTKVVGDDGEERFVTRRICIPGQPVFITTSVADKVDLKKYQLDTRMLSVYLKYNYNSDVVEEILDRTGSGAPDVDKMVFTAYLLRRPEMADLTLVKKEIVAFIDNLAKLTPMPVYRTAEIVRNLVRSVAVAKGKTKADKEDLDFVLRNFQLDILYNGLGLTERDVEFLEALPDEGGLKTQQVIDALKFSKQYVLTMLKNLERKGLVEGEGEKTYTWSLTSLGRRIKELVNNVNSDVIEVRDKNGRVTGAVNSKFRPDGGGAEEGAVPGADGTAVRGGERGMDSIMEAYQFLKEHGWFLTTDLVAKFGVGVLEALKKKDLVTFNVVDGAEYVGAK